MLYIWLAVLSSTAIIILFKLFGQYKINSGAAITWNYLTASILGLFSIDEVVSFHLLAAKPWFYYAVATGFMLIVAFNIFSSTAKKAGVVITAISSRMSVIIPVISGFVIFHEDISWQRIMGILMGMIAFFFAFYNDQIDKKQLLNRWKLPFLLFIAVGANDTLMKIAQYYVIGNDFLPFLTVAFIVSFIMGSLLLMKQRVALELIFKPKQIVGGISIGIVNWYSTLWFLYSLDQWPVSIAVPVINVGIVALSALCGYLFFHEHLQKINWIGLALAVMAIIVMSK